MLPLRTCNLPHSVSCLERPPRFSYNPHLEGVVLAQQEAWSVIVLGGLPGGGAGALVHVHGGHAGHVTCRSFSFRLIKVHNNGQRAVWPLPARRGHAGQVTCKSFFVLFYQGPQLWTTCCVAAACQERPCWACHLQIIFRSVSSRSTMVDNVLCGRCLP